MRAKLGRRRLGKTMAGDGRKTLDGVNALAMLKQQNNGDDRRTAGLVDNDKDFLFFFISRFPADRRQRLRRRWSCMGPRLPLVTAVRRRQFTVD